MSILSNISVNLKNLFITAKKRGKNSISNKIKLNSITDSSVIKDLHSLLNSNDILATSILAKLKNTPVYSAITTYRSSLPDTEQKKFDLLGAFFNVLSNVVGIDFKNTYTDVYNDLSNLRDSIIDTKVEEKVKYNKLKEWKSKYGYSLNQSDITKLNNKICLYGVLYSLKNKIDTYIDDSLVTTEPEVTNTTKSDTLTNLEKEIIEYLYTNYTPINKYKRTRNSYDSMYTLSDYEATVNRKFDTVKDLPITIYDDDNIISSIINQFTHGNTFIDDPVLSMFYKLISACNITYGDLNDYIFTRVAYNNPDDTSLSTTVDTKDNKSNENNKNINTLDDELEKVNYAIKLIEQKLKPSTDKSALSKEELVMRKDLGNLQLKLLKLLQQEKQLTASHDFKAGWPLLYDNIFKTYILPTFSTTSTAAFVDKKNINDIDNDINLLNNKSFTEDVRYPFEKYSPTKGVFDPDVYKTIDGYDIRSIYDLNIKDFLANFNITKLLSGGTNLAKLKSYIGNIIGVIKNTSSTDDTYTLYTHELTDNITSDEALAKINDFLTDNISSVNIQSLSKDQLLGIRSYLLPLCAEFFKSYLLSSSQVYGNKNTQVGHYSPSNIVPALNNSVALTNAHSGVDHTDYYSEDDDYNGPREQRILSDSLLEEDLPSLTTVYEGSSTFGNKYSKMHEPDTLIQSPQESFDTTMLFLDHLIINNKDTLSSFIESIKRNILLEVARYRSSANYTSFLYLNDPLQNQADLKQAEAIFNTCVSSLATAYQKDSTITKKIEADVKKYSDKLYNYKKQLKNSEYLLKKYTTLLSVFKKQNQKLKATDFLSKDVLSQQDSLIKLAKQYLKIANNPEKLDDFLNTHDISLLNLAVQCYTDKGNTNSLLSKLNKQLKATNSSPEVSTITAALEKLCSNYRLKISQDRKNITDIISTLQTNIQNQVLDSVNTTFNSVISSLSTNKKLTLPSSTLQDMRKSLFEKFKYTVYNINPILQTDLYTRTQDKNLQDENTTIASLDKTKFLQDILDNNLDQVTLYSNFCLFYNDLYKDKGKDLITSYWEYLPSKEQKKLEALKKAIGAILVSQTTPTKEDDVITKDINSLSVPEFLYKYATVCFNSKLLSNKDRKLLSYFYDMSILNTSANKDNINPGSYIYYLNSNSYTQRVLSTKLHSKYNTYLKYLKEDKDAQTTFLSNVNTYLSKGHTNPISTIEELMSLIKDNINSITYKQRNLNTINLDMSDDDVFKRYIAQTLFYSTAIDYYNKDDEKALFEKAYTSAYTITPPDLNIYCDVAVKSRLIYLSMTNRRDIPLNTLTKWDKEKSKDLEGKPISKTKLLKQNAELSDLFTKLYYELEKGASSIANDFVFEDKLKLTEKDISDYKLLAAKLQKNKNKYNKLYSLYNNKIIPLLQLIQDDQQYVQYIDSMFIVDVLLNNHTNKNDNTNLRTLLSSKDWADLETTMDTLKKELELEDTSKLSELFKDLEEFRKLNTKYYLLKNNMGYAYDEDLPIVQKFVSIGDKVMRSSLSSKKSLKDALDPTLITHHRYYLLTSDIDKLLTYKGDTLQDKFRDYIQRNRTLKPPHVFVFSWVASEKNDNPVITENNEVVDEYTGKLKDLSVNYVISDNISILSLKNLYTEIPADLAAIILHYVSEPYTAVSDSIINTSKNNFIENLLKNNKRNPGTNTPDNLPALNTEDTNSLLETIDSLQLTDINKDTTSNNNNNNTIDKESVFFNRNLIITANNPTPFLGIDNLGNTLTDTSNTYTSPNNRKESKDQFTLETPNDATFNLEFKDTNNTKNTDEYTNIPASDVCLVLSNLYRTNKLTSVLSKINSSFIRAEDLEKFELFLSKLPNNNWEFTATVESLGLGRRLMQDILNRVVVPVLQDEGLL